MRMHQFRKYLAAIIAFLTLALASQAAMAQGCSRDAIQQAASEARTSRERLLAIKIADDLSTEVPPFIEKEIHVLKDGLADTIFAYMRCEQSDSVDLKAMETSLLGMLAVDEPKERTEPSTAIQSFDGVYGIHLNISISRPPTEPQLIAVTVNFGIECGDDSMLLIYERSAERWKESLRWQSDNYSQISDAFGDFFQYAVLPQNERGEWVVAIAHGTPWCTSVWSAFALDLVRPKRDGSPQQILQHIKDYYVREDYPAIKQRPDGFEFRVIKGSLDDDVSRRTGIYRFRLVDNKLERVQPIAMNGRDFVDEWLQVAWSDAQRWSQSVNLASLAKEHSRFVALQDPKAKKSTLFTYSAVRACSDDPKHFQVALNLNSGPGRYFQIKQGDNSFTMLSAATQPDPRCKGGDLMH
jgi:hypothetical protein